MSDDPIRKFLESREIRFQEYDGGDYEHKYVDFNFNGENTTIHVGLHYSEGGNVFTVYAMVNNKIPKKSVSEAIKLANRANYTSRFGSMIVNEKTGGFWVRLANADTDTPDDVVFHAAVSNACETIDHFFPALMQIIYSGCTAEEAIDNLYSDDDENQGSTPPPPPSGYV